MPGTNLTRVEAEARASAVTDVTYEVTLDLTTSERTFSTTSTIRFTSPTRGWPPSSTSSASRSRR